MRSINVDQWTVNEVAANVAGAKDVLYAQGISATHRFNLANAAAAATVTTDELLAVMNYRVRRAAAHAPAVRKEIEEAELVA